MKFIPRSMLRSATLVLLLLSLCFALTLAIAQTAAAQAPVVQRIEPPNWWVGLPPNPMLLVTGENLSASTASVVYPGVRIVRTEPQPGGRYLFLWLEISAGARPGDVPITLRTSAGTAVVRFPLAARRPTRGSFQGLSEGDVIYLIMPDRFADGDPSNNQPAQSPGTYDRSKQRAYHGGDLRGIREHLPYLRELGITALWLTPIQDNDNRSPNDYHGYGAVDYYAVEEHFGSLADLQQLVAAAHQQGIKVFLDCVPNHIGPRHPWVQAPPQPDWFHGTVAKHLVAHSPFDGLTDPHSVPQQWRDVVEGWFADVLPDMNQENPQVARYLLQNSIWWAEQTGIDGYRLDTFPYASRRFWSDWHRGLRRAYPHLDTIGEVFNLDPTVTSFFAGGHAQFDGIDSGLTTPFDFPFYFALRNVVLRGAPAKLVVDVLQRDWLYPNPQLLVPFLGNHDVKRFMSEPGGSKEKLKLAFSLLLTVRGIPELYYGDEIGMEGADDPDNRRDFPGGFPGDSRNAFTAAGRTADEQEIFQHVQALLQLRKSHPALARGTHRHIAWDDTFYAFVREIPGEKLLVVFNNASAPRKLQLQLADTPLEDCHSLEPLFSVQPAALEGRVATLEVAGRTVAIYRAK